jgi:hypothetical protein
MRASVFSLLALIVLGFTACSTQRTASLVETSTDAARFTIGSVEMSGDSLLVELTYSGSGQHSFAIAGNGMATKSLPPQIPVRIVDQVEGDFGRALITHTVALDLTPFRMPGQGRVALKIAGWDAMLIYTY